MSTPRTPHGGIDPRIWGGAAWQFIQNVLKGFDPATQNRQALTQWINLLPNVLPCERCRGNFTQTLQKYPIGPYATQGKLREWYARVRTAVRKHEAPKKSTAFVKQQLNINWGYIMLGAAVTLGVGAYIGYRMGTREKQTTTTKD